MDYHTHVYHCTNPEENHIPNWMKMKKSKPEKTERNLVEEFKNNPDSFFPDFYKKTQ